jgi:soluble lytic murein transglycosylase
MSRFYALRFLTRLLPVKLLLAAALSAAVSYPAAAAEIDQQRELFQSVFETVERGDWSAVENLAVAERQQLERYLLWPDLRAAYLRATLKRADGQAVKAFLDQYGTLKPARELRYRYALDLARRGMLDGYFDIYQAYYQGLEIEKLDCLALQAELAAGREQRVAYRAKELWLVGKSQVEECDLVFEHLVDVNALATRDYLLRFDLAVTAREFSLARWLGKSIDESHVEQANAWLEAHRDPERFLVDYSKRANTNAAHRQFVYAVEQLTFADPQRALELWIAVRPRFGFSEEQKLRTARHIALWTARDSLPDAYALLVDLPQAAQNNEVMRWRARTSLREQAWPQLLKDIQAMTADEYSNEEWRYWRAMALQQEGQVLAAKADLQSLAIERSYYGFLAADKLNLPYSLQHTGLNVDEDKIAEMASRNDLLRARELYLVGLDGRGRSEWDAAVAWFTPAEKAQAAVLADRWGWHSRAISTAASVGEFDDLSLRYPMPFAKDFEQHSSSAQISTPWAYGIARSESLFMRDIRSSAGAIGLMQLMPATGRTVANEINLPYFGLDTLTNPQSNIRLGTMYLGEMARRYGGNRVLATAAYNAGPHRVDRWIPEQGSIDARIWIENIPFNETRNYVRRVLVAETIFYWRMTGQMRRLSEGLPRVEALNNGTSGGHAAMSRVGAAKSDTRSSYSESR